MGVSSAVRRCRAPVGVQGVVLVGRPRAWLSVPRRRRVHASREDSSIYCNRDRVNLQEEHN